MVTGCILIKLKTGKDREALYNLKEIETKHIYALFGEYDVLMILEADDLKELTAFVMDKVREIDGVNSTRTIIAAEI